MRYLHDLWVNWFEGEENSYNVCHYHEWHENDRIVLLDQIPLLYITTSLYNYIANDLQEIPKKLLQEIYRKTYIRRRQLRQVIDFAAVVTDGRGIIAFDTTGYEIPIRKSRLMPRQEQLVFRTIRKMSQKNFRFNSKNYKKEYHTLSMKPEYVLGLTRKERHLKQILMMALDQLRTTDNIEELRYWLTEWDPKNYEAIKKMDGKTAWIHLYQGIKYGWTAKHIDLGEKLIKEHPFLEKLWTAKNTYEDETILK